ncbi:MAG: hypothetical protein Q9209_006811 [Squamulea sp. 1 TL-2023]
MLVPFRPGHLRMSKAGVGVESSSTVVASGTVVLDAEVKVLLLKEDDGAVTVTNIVLKLAGYVGIKLVKMGELEFAEELGKPEGTRIEPVALVDAVGKPTVGREDVLRLPMNVRENDDLVEFADCVGNPEVGRGVILRLADGVGNPETLRVTDVGRKPELGRGVMLLFIDRVGKLELGRGVTLALMDGDGKLEEANEVRLPVGSGGKPELGRVDKLVLDTERLVPLDVGTMVGRVPDEAKVFDKDWEVLILGIDGETRELREPTILEPVPIADVTGGTVVKGGIGLTVIADEIVVSSGELPCRVSSWVVVPVVT